MISRLSQGALPALVLLAAATLVGCATTDGATQARSNQAEACETTLDAAPFVGYWTLDDASSVAQFCPKGAIEMVAACA